MCSDSENNSVENDLLIGVDMKIAKRPKNNWRCTAANFEPVGQ